MPQLAHARNYYLGALIYAIKRQRNKAVSLWQNKAGVSFVLISDLECFTLHSRYNLEDVAGLELYDHSSDPGENFNLAGEKYYSWVLHHCFTLIRSYVK